VKEELYKQKMSKPASLSGSPLVLFEMTIFNIHQRDKTSGGIYGATSRQWCEAGLLVLEGGKRT